MGGPLKDWRTSGEDGAGRLLALNGHDDDVKEVGVLWEEDSLEPL